MAKDLKNIIRIQEWEVDEKRRKLGDLLRLAEELENQARRLEEELLREQAAARASPAEAGILYGGYAKVVIMRRDYLAQSLARTENEIAAARDVLREAYRELKKYQVAQENREKREALALARKDQAFLDEVGLQGFRRKQA